MSKLVPSKELDALYARVLAGESTAQVARSIGRKPESFYGVFRRHYGHVYNGDWSLTISIPEDIPTRAYLAGLIDGEGSIMLAKTGWQISIGMTHKGVIEWLRGFGGNLNEHQPRDGNRQRVYTWRCARRLDVIAVLEAVIPYMIVKKEIALKALAALKGDHNASN